jgi:hypothetical protein
MGVIRFNDDIFTVDSQEYEILHNAALKVKGVEGAVVEIGTRRGGSAKIIIDTLYMNEDTNRSMFCIDPYGNIDYVQTNKSLSVHNPEVSLEGDPESTEITQAIKLDYTNDMRNQIIPSLYYYAFKSGLNFTFFCLEDSEFFKRYADGVPVYDQNKKLEDKYAFVFFDGPHNTEIMVEEVNFFIERCIIGSVFVFDDIWMYDHDVAIESILLDNGFEILEKKKVKASYVKKA